MANPDHVKLLRQSVNAWNEWRKREIVRPDLDGADLSWANLGLANLSDVDLIGANLYNTFLAGANLGLANFIETELHEADLSDAQLFATVFAGVDLRTVRGLESVLHVGPSHIGIDTIYASGGNIPEVFLRGAGVPDSFITFMRSLTAKPIEFYSCFISHSTRDKDFADRICADLQANGVRCWFAPHDVQGGRKLHEQIDEAIRVHEKLLLILSPDSMSSEWVKTEIAKARKREVRDQARVLFPVRLV
jgi:hypothetical protein